MHRLIENTALRWTMVVVASVVILMVTVAVRMGLGWPLWPGAGAMVLLISLAANYGRRSKQ